MTTPSTTLILAWGNPGRRDDGLGPAFATAASKRRLPGVVVEAEYQLQVENAVELAAFDRVLFVDADRSGVEPFSCRRIQPTGSSASFSTHIVTPETLLALTRALFRRQPEAWILGIRGYEFDDFGESLSPQARQNLRAALRFVEAAVRTGSLSSRLLPEKSPAVTKRDPLHEERAP